MLTTIEMNPGHLTHAQERDLLTAIEQELHAEVSNRWRQYYPGRSGHGTPTVTLTPRSCGFSAIYRVDLDFPGNGRERLIVKIRREQMHGSFSRSDLSERTLKLVRAEYDEHLKAANYFAHNPSGLAVVRLLDFIESHNALVVEFAAGEDLSRLVRDGSPIVPGAIERAGQWWRLFHGSLHTCEWREWSPHATDSMIDRRLTRLRTVGAPDVTLDALRQAIGRTTRAVTPSAVPVSRIHGDCKLRHIWATPDQIQVLDFGNSSIGDAWIDPAALVVELSLYSLWTTRLDAAGRTDDIRTLLRAYFDGPPPPAFALYVVDALLKKWHRRLRSWGAGSALTRLRQSLRSARLDTLVDRWYVDRWFTAQIRAWLALAEGRPPAWLRNVIE